MYRYAPRENHEDLSPGGVLFSAPGFPAFPVRLAAEIFRRASASIGGPAVVWDPCCGSGYLLTALSLSHRDAIAGVIGSDVDPDALSLARQNLGLLTAGGLDARAAELRDRARRYGKPSYVLAAETAGRLRDRLTEGGGPLPVAVAAADAFDPEQLRAARGDQRPRLVITDVPYGEQTRWRGAGATAGVGGLLNAFAQVLEEEAVIAVATRGRRVSGATPSPGSSRSGWGAGRSRCSGLDPAPQGHRPTAEQTGSRPGEGERPFLSGAGGRA